MRNTTNNNGLEPGPVRQQGKQRPGKQAGELAGWQGGRTAAQVACTRAGQLENQTQLTLAWRRPRRCSSALPRPAPAPWSPCSAPSHALEAAVAATPRWDSVGRAGTDLFDPCCNAALPVPIVPGQRASKTAPSTQRCLRLQVNPPAGSRKTASVAILSAPCRRCTWTRK